MGDVFVSLCLCAHGGTSEKKKRNALPRLGRTKQRILSDSLCGPNNLEEKELIKELSRHCPVTEGKSRSDQSSDCRTMSRERCAQVPFFFIFSLVRTMHRHATKWSQNCESGLTRKIKKEKVETGRRSRIDAIALRMRTFRSTLWFHLFNKDFWTTSSFSLSPGRIS